MLNRARLSERLFDPRSKRAILLLGFGIVFPVLVQGFVVDLAIEIMFFALYAMGLGLLVGYTGLISFGHAAFFGTGAYLSGLILSNLTTSIWATVVLSLLVVSVIAAIIGYMSLKRSGIYFAMLTLAFSQLIYIFVYNDFLEFTGGSNGLSGIPSGNFGIPGVLFVRPQEAGFYYLMLAIIVVVYVTIYKIVNSPTGAVFIAIRENDERLQFAGYNTGRYKLLSFTLSGVFGALGGILYAPFYSAVSPSLLFWSLSGEGLAMVIIGGMKTIIGPIVGAALFVVTREIVSPYITDWRIALGIIFIVFIILQPDGLVKLVNNAVDRLKRE